MRRNTAMSAINSVGVLQACLSPRMAQHQRVQMRRSGQRNVLLEIFLYFMV